MVTFDLPLYAAIIVTFIAAAAMGAINGQIVIRTGLPSFIVTLAFLFILRGLSLVGLKAATGGSTQLRGIRAKFEGSWLADFFSGEHSHHCSTGWLKLAGSTPSSPASPK